MLDAIRSFFADNLSFTDSNEDIDQQLRLAAAALMFEVIRADQSIEASEQATLKTTLKQQFDIDSDAVEALIQLADEQSQEAVSLYQFTHLINEHYTPQQKIAVIQGMWDIAYADENIDRYEEAVIRKVAELLYVPHQDFIRCKLIAAGQY